MNLTILTPVAAAVCAAMFATSNVGAHDVDTARETQVAKTRAYVSIPDLDLETYAGLASSMVMADVTGIRTIDVAGQLLRTEYTLSVIDTYFGDIVGTAKVQIAGGATATREYIVEHAPNFVVGDRGVFFLLSHEEVEFHSLLGLEKGFYPIAHNGDKVTLTGEHAADATALDQFLVQALEGREAFVTAEVTR